MADDLLERVLEFDYLTNPDNWDAEDSPRGEGTRGHPLPHPVLNQQGIARPAPTPAGRGALQEGMLRFLHREAYPTVGAPTLEPAPPQPPRTSGRSSTAGSAQRQANRRRQQALSLRPPPGLLVELEHADVVALRAVSTSTAELVGPPRLRASRDSFQCPLYPDAVGAVLYPTNPTID